MKNIEGHKPSLSTFPIRATACGGPSAVPKPIETGLAKYFFGHPPNTYAVLEHNIGIFFLFVHLIFHKMKLF